VSPGRHDWPVLFHRASLLLAAAGLLYLGRGAWFYYDEWDVAGNGALPLLQPHSEHWSTLPYLAYRALYAAFGLRQYLPYLAVVIALHVGLAHFLWHVLRRQGVAGWPAAGLAAAFLVLGAGSENLVWAWQMGTVGSVFFGYAALLLATGAAPSRRRDVLAAAALVAAQMCSGIGLVMLLVSAIAITLRRSVAIAAGVVAVPLVAFVAWYATFGHQVSGQHYSRPSITGSLQFVWVGLTSTAELASGLKWLGPLLVGAALAWVGWRARTGLRRHPVALAGVIGAVALFALISAGRLQFGPDSARQGRYVYLGAALLVPVAGLALQQLVARGRAGELAVALLVTWAAVHGARVLVPAEAAHGAISAHTRRLVLDAATRMDRGEPFDPAARPDPAAAPTLTLARVAVFRTEGALPSG
jgi:hypothetical protein